MKHILLSVLAVFLLCTACQQADKHEHSEHYIHHEEEKGNDKEGSHEDDDDGHDNDESSDDGDGIHFGEFIEEEGAIPIEDVVEKVKEGGEMEVKIRASVSDVCQKKGCWMNVTSADGSTDHAMFVQFKDYGFFMPLDLGGGEVVMVGKAYMAVTPVDELRHFAEDAGKSEEEIAAITEPKEELKFLASGVVIVDDEAE